MLAGVRERGEADNIFLCVRYIQGIYWRLQLIIVLIFPTTLSLWLNKSLYWYSYIAVSSIQYSALAEWNFMPLKLALSDSFNY